MATATYIQEAANQVRNAIAALEDEIKSIQHDTYSREATLKSSADKAENEAGLTRLRAASTTQQGPEVAFDARTAQLEVEAKQKLQEAQKLSSEAANAVQGKTSLINSLRGALSQLENLAGAAR
jgi:hypothetical protein